jgi:hypothetical protein
MAIHVCQVTNTVGLQGQKNENLTLQNLIGQFLNAILNAI